MWIDSFVEFLQQSDILSKVIEAIGYLLMFMGGILVLVGFLSILAVEIGKLPIREDMNKLIYRVVLLGFFYLLGGALVVIFVNILMN